MRNNIEGANIRDCVHYGFYGATGMMTLGANLVMAGDEPMYLSLDPGGVVRDVRLPVNEAGLTFYLTHIGGAFDITIKDSTGVTTVGTLSTTETAMVFCRPGAAGALGWSISVSKNT